MGVRVSVKGDVKGVLSSLESIQRSHRPLAARAINYAMRRVNTMAKREIATKLQVPQRNVSRRMRSRWANRWKLVATTRLFTQRMPAHSLLSPGQLSISLTTRRAKAQTGKGVRAGKHFWKSAFVQVVHSRQVVLRRIGKPRYPLEVPGVEFGPDAEATMDRLMRLHAGKLTKKEFERLLKVQLSKQATAPITRLAS